MNIQYPTDNFQRGAIEKDPLSLRCLCADIGRDYVLYGRIDRFGRGFDKLVCLGSA